MLELLVKPVEDGQSALMSMHLVAGLNGFVWTGNYGPCVTCGSATTWVDLAFECRLCPGVCSQKMQDEFQWAELTAYLSSPEHRALVDSLRDETMMRCPNKDCRPPSYCGLCKGTGKIPD